MLTAVHNSDSRLSPTVRGRTLSRALHELRTAVREIAVDETEGGAPAARALVEVLDGFDGSASAQELLDLFLVVDRARNAARKAPPPARYNWRPWSEVSRLTGGCIIASLRAMRSNVDAHHLRGAGATPDVATRRGVAP